MEGGRRSSTALLLLALMLAASSTTTAAAAQCRPPPADGSYKLITILTSRGDKVKLALRADDSSIAGFANGKNDWFAIQGSEDLLEPFRNRYGGGGDIPSHGLVNLLGALLKKNATS
jgi:opacity protein-like surface antigen